MAASTNIPTKLKKSQVVNAGPQLKFDTDTLECMLVKAGSGIPSTTSGGIQFVSDITGTNAEVSGTGYSRQTLSSVTVAFDGSINTYVDFSFGDVNFTQSAGGFTDARYIIFYDATTSTSDAARPVIAVCDPDQTLSAVSGDVVLTCPTGGLIQWQ